MGYVNVHVNWGGVGWDGAKWQQLFAVRRTIPCF